MRVKIEYRGIFDLRWQNIFDEDLSPQQIEEIANFAERVKQTEYNDHKMIGNVEISSEEQDYVSDL